MKLDVGPDIPGLWEEHADIPTEASTTKMSKMEKVISVHVHNKDTCNSFTCIARIFCVKHWTN